MCESRSIFAALVLAILWLQPARVPAAQPGVSAIRGSFRVFSGPNSGTAFFVAQGDPATAGRKCLLVTAAHVMESLGGEKCTVAFRAPVANQQFERRPVEFPIRKDNAPLWVRHPAQDIAVLGVELPESIDINVYSEDQIATEKFAEEGKMLPGQDVFIPCFPAQFEANGAGFPVLRRGSIASFPLTPLSSVQTMLVDYTSVQGDSGSPVVAWIDQQPVVVGLVAAMHRQTDRTVTSNEERTVHTSLGLAVAIQGPCIREAIAEWRKQAR